MRMNHLPRHGQSGRPYFTRWRNITQMCYNENNAHYGRYGAKGIGMGWRWHPMNPQGAKNFLDWLDYELRKYRERYPDRKDEPFEVSRKRITGSFSPCNCRVAPRGLSTQIRSYVAMTEKEAVAMRRYRKAHPKVTYDEMEKKFGFPSFAIYQAVRGYTWKSANKLEAPIKSRYAQEEHFEQGTTHAQPRTDSFLGADSARSA
jgi:hypothetical protein